MKTKILCLLLALLFVFSLTACGDTSTDTTEDTTVDKTVKDTAKDTTKDTTKDTAKQEGELTVTGEKFTYKDGHVLLLDTANGTGTNYTVTITVSYLDAEGAELKKQKQTFEGFSSGAQKYFLFNPRMAFDSYTYTVETEEYSGECYLHYIKTSGLAEDLHIIQDVSENHEWISADYGISNTGSDTLYIAPTFLLVTEAGDLYFQDARNAQTMLSGNSKGDLSRHVIEGTLNTVTIPEELQGNVRGFIVIRQVSNEPLN